MKMKLLGVLCLLAGFSLTRSRREFCGQVS
jgi:hypothetical protein